MRQESFREFSQVIVASVVPGRWMDSRGGAPGPKQWVRVVVHQ